MSEISLDIDKLEALSGKVVTDITGAIGVLLSYIGDQSGVYRALEAHGPCTTSQLASTTGLNERYLQEFLSSNAGSGYVTYDGQANEFSITPEQAAVLVHEGKPTCVQGFIQAVVSQYATHSTALDVFKTGRGRPWSEHHICCFCGTDRVFGPQYEANLIDSWIPSLDGIQAKLESGSKVADVACGHGSSTILMAEKFPNSTIHGFDSHEPSIEVARGKAKEAELSNVDFFVSTAKEIPNNGYNFACIFDALHDMGDPIGAAKHINDILVEDGTFMLVEPLAGDTLEENLDNPLSALFYGFSTLVCVPCSKAQEVGLGLGAQAGQARLTKVLNEAGFTQVRRTTETHTNMILEVRT